MFPKVALVASSILGASRSIRYNFIDFCRLLFHFPHIQSLPPVVMNGVLTKLLIFLGLVFQDLEASSGPQDALSRSQLFLACAEHPPTPGANTGTWVSSAPCRIGSNAPSLVKWHFHPEVKANP